MQERVHEHEKKVYDATQLMGPDTVARSILHVVDLPTDTSIHDFTIRPMPHHKPGESPSVIRLVEGAQDSRTSITPLPVSLRSHRRRRTRRELADQGSREQQLDFGES
jgi:hypothetical protein